MLKIDKTTGLPELPNTHFWRVSEDGVSIRMRLPDSEWTDTYYRDYNETRAVEKTRKVRKGIFRRKVEETYEVVQYRDTGRSVGVAKAYTEKSGETVTRPGTYLRYTGIWTPDITIELRKKLTREDILPLCEKALKEWEVQKLYGDYPPNKL